MLRPTLRDLRPGKGNCTGLKADGFWGPDVRLRNRLGTLKKSAGVRIGRRDGIVAANGNFVNVGTVINVVITRGPILEGIERDSEKDVPCMVC